MSKVPIKAPEKLPNSGEISIWEQLWRQGTGRGGGGDLGGGGRNDDQDANDPRRDNQHAKATGTEDITAKDNTAEDTNGSYSYPLVGPRPEEAPDSDYSTEHRYGRFPRAHS